MVARSADVIDDRAHTRTTISRGIGWQRWRHAARRRLQARRALSYVLNNWRKHGEDRAGEARRWNVDPFSTGVLFHGWGGREDASLMWKWRDTYDPLVVYLPDTWLLREGWSKHGRVGFHVVPSAPRAAVA